MRAAGALVKQGDRDAARGVLERSLGFHPRSAELVRELATLSWEAGDTERAFKESREAIEFDPEDENSWALHHRYASPLHREHDVVALARRLARERPWNGVIWLRLAEVLQRESENLASLDALAEALERRPGWSEAIDVYVMTLARVGRKDDALAACERPTESFFAQGALKARRAWVLWRFGEHEVACEAMHRVIAEHPNHAWAHLVLFEWEMERGRHKQGLGVARALVELAPLAATSHALVAEAELGDGNAAKARECLEQAVALDPSNVHAGTRRIELAISERRLEDGARFVREQGPHVPPETRDQWELSLAVSSADEAAALAVFERLACRPTVPVVALYRAAKQLEDFAPRSLDRSLGTLARRPEVNREAGALWVTTLDHVSRRPSIVAIFRLRRHNRETFETAVRAYFEALGDRAVSPVYLLVALAWLGREARRSDATWGHVGYALARTRAYVLCQLWLRDYPGRRSAEAWMLHNYRVATLENHQRAAALRCVEHALTLPADNTLAYHLTFAAFGRAADGDIAGAREIVAGRTLQGLGEPERWLFDNAELLVRVADATGDERVVTLRELRMTSGGLLAALSPFTAGLLRRWLAAGVLRHGWDAGFLARRFGIWLALVGGVLLWPGRTVEGGVATVAVLAAAYAVARLFR